jgi:hypothetical protein
MSFQMDMYLTELIVFFLVGICGVAPVVTYFKEAHSLILKNHDLFFFNPLLILFGAIWLFISGDTYSTMVYDFVRAEVIK